MTTSTVNIQLFQLLKHKLGERDAETLIDLMDTRFMEINEANLKMVATKEDIYRLGTRLEAKISDLKLEIGHVEIDTLRWVIGLFIVTMLAVTGLYFKQ